MLARHSLTAQRSSFSTNVSLHPRNQQLFFVFLDTFISTKTKIWFIMTTWLTSHCLRARSWKYLLYLKWPDLVCTKKTTKIQTTLCSFLIDFFHHFECKTNNRRGASPVVMWAMVVKTSELRGILSAKFSIHQTICVPTIWDLWPKESDWTYKQLKWAFP